MFWAPRFWQHPAQTAMSDGAKSLILHARELLSDINRWTQGGEAKNANERITGARSPDAVCWCILGALTREAWNRHPISDDLEIARKVVANAVRERQRIPHEEETLWEGARIARFNDGPRTKHSDVLEVLDYAASHTSA